MSAEDTRLKIMRAAEELIAREGVDAVSLRQVSVAAGQRNTSATQYHFTDKRTLVEEILWRHSVGIQAQWTQTLDILEGEDVSAEALVQLMLHPIVAKLHDEDGGWEYVELCTQLLGHPTMPLVETRAATAEAPQRLIARLLERSAIPPELLLLRILRVTATIYLSVHAYGRALRGGVPTVPEDVFVADLGDDVVRMITSPPSEATAAALERARQRR